ncbi:hypothetical protein S83_024767, partial [Arachis hypogaea]
LTQNDAATERCGFAAVATNLNNRCYLRRQTFVILNSRSPNSPLCNHQPKIFTEFYSNFNNTLVLSNINKHHGHGRIIANLRPLDTVEEDDQGNRIGYIK